MSSNSPRNWIQTHRNDILVCLFLASVTLAVFWQVQGHDFITFDDVSYITKNPHIQQGISLQAILRAFTTTRGGMWIPLTWISFMVNYEFHGLMPSAYLITNVFLHVAGSLLLFLLLRLTTCRLWASAFVAVLFAIHPLRVESVAWATERKDVLSGLFWMLTMLAYAYYVRRPSLAKYATVFAFFSLGLMSKPMVVTLPFVLLLMDYWPLGRYRQRPVDGQVASILQIVGLQNAKISPFLTFLLEKVPFFAAAALVSLVTLLASKQAGYMPTLQTLPLWVRLWNAVVFYAEYMAKMLWPSPMAIFYPHPSEGFSAFRVAVSASVLVLFSSVFIRLARHHPYLLIGWLWFLVTLLPVIGLFQTGAQGMADRFTYVPMIGLFIVCAWSIDLATTSLGSCRGVLLWGVLVACTFVMGLSTFRQVTHWRNSVSLLEHTVGVTRNNFVVHYRLALALFEEARIHDSIKHLRAALAINPLKAEAHNALGVALARLGDLDGARYHFQEAIRLKPGYKEADSNLKAVSAAN